MVDGRYVVTKWSEKMKQSEEVAILVCFAVIILFGCTGQALPVSKTTIGVMAPLTGNAAELGQHVQRGIELANENLGNKYSFVWEDDQCTNTESAIASAQKLSGLDKVKLVIGPLCAPPYQAVAGIFNQNKVGFMHTSGVTPPFVKAAGDFGIAGISTTIPQEDAFLADFIFNEQNIRKMAVLVWDAPWSVEHRNGFVARFEQNGGEIVFDETVSIDETDFRTIAQKIKASGSQGVFVVALNFQNAAIVKQFRENGLEIPVFGQFEIEDPAFLAPAGTAAEEVTYVYPKIDFSNPKTQAFINAYTKKFGSAPNYYAFIGYDSVQLYDSAIRACSGTDSKCVVNWIRSAQNFAGVSGTMSFNPDKTISREFEIKTVRNGEFVPFAG